MLDRGLTPNGGLVAEGYCFIFRHVYIAQWNLFFYTLFDLLLIREVNNDNPLIPAIE